MKTIRNKWDLARALSFNCVTLIALGGGAPLASAQNGPSQEGNNPGLLQREQMLPELQMASRKMGDRLTVAGKEQVVLTGTLSDANGPRPVRVTWQVGGWFRLEEMGGQGRVLLFDGAHLKNTKGEIGADERRLLDSLVIGLPENVFWQAANAGVAMRFLGGRFRATDSVAADYSGPYSDLFALYPPADSTRGLFMTETQHVIGLDSDTLLLTRVEHPAGEGGASSDVQTQLLNWTQQAGQWYPATITRLENGQKALQFSITSFQVTAASSIAEFRN